MHVFATPSTVFIWALTIYLTGTTGRCGNGKTLPSLPSGSPCSTSLSRDPIRWGFWNWTERSPTKRSLSLTKLSNFDGNSESTNKEDTHRFICWPQRAVDCRFQSYFKKVLTLSGVEQLEVVFEVPAARDSQVLHHVRHVSLPVALQGLLSRSSLLAQTTLRENSTAETSPSLCSTLIYAEVQWHSRLPRTSLRDTGKRFGLCFFLARWQNVRYHDILICPILVATPRTGNPAPEFEKILQRGPECVCVCVYACVVCVCVCFGVPSCFVLLFVESLFFLYLCTACPCWTVKTPVCW